MSSNPNSTLGPPLHPEDDEPGSSSGGSNGMSYAGEKIGPAWWAGHEVSVRQMEQSGCSPSEVIPRFLGWAETSNAMRDAQRAWLAQGFGGTGRDLHKVGSSIQSWTQTNVDPDLSSQSPFLVKETPEWAYEAYLNHSGMVLRCRPTAKASSDATGLGVRLATDHYFVLDFDQDEATSAQQIGYASNLAATWGLKTRSIAPMPPSSTLESRPSTPCIVSSDPRPHWYDSKPELPPPSEEEMYPWRLTNTPGTQKPSELTIDRRRLKGLGIPDDRVMPCMADVSRTVLGMSDPRDIKEQLDRITEKWQGERSPEAYEGWRFLNVKRYPLGHHCPLSILQGTDSDRSLVGIHHNYDNNVSFTQRPKAPFPPTEHQQTHTPTAQGLSRVTMEMNDQAETNKNWGSFKTSRAGRLQEVASKGRESEGR